MTPELSIVPGEQKDRMELHNKNWDSSSANTPDSSEGDFQTEVWRHADVWRHPLKQTRSLVPRCRGTQRHRTTEKLYIGTRVLCKDHTHTLYYSPPPHLLRCALSDPIVYVYCCSGQTWKEDCSTLYFRKDYWKERTGAWHVCDWLKKRRFLNEL